MENSEIIAEYEERAQRWGKHPGLTKLIESAVRKHEVKNSYDFDVLLTMFMTKNAFPDLDLLSEDFERTAEELAIESNYEKEPTTEDIMNRLVLKSFENVEQAAKTAVGRLFGELDGDPEVDEYMRHRVSEYMKLQTATFQYLTSLEKKDHDVNDG